MTLERRIARLMAMDDAAWARHANPWSVWTRVPILPLVLLALWSRVWLGWWALLPVMLLLGWTWLNPRAFPPPARTDGWAARGVRGERLWLARDREPVPPHHRTLPTLLVALSASAAALALVGVAVLDPCLTIAGGAMAMTCKLWFVDRMVWLQRDTAEPRP